MVARGFVLGLVLPLIVPADASAGEAARLGPTPAGQPARALRSRVLCSEPRPWSRPSDPGLGRRCLLRGSSAGPLPDGVVLMPWVAHREIWVYLSGEAQMSQNEALGVFE